MLAFIFGTLTEKHEDYIVVETESFGFEIFVPTSVLGSLKVTNEKVKIFTYFQPREDSFTLYGFLTKEDKTIFKRLLQVNGIGPRAALSILSALSVHELKLAILNNDYVSISKAQGVGKKTAQKVILELKDKLDLDIFDDFDEEVDVSGDAQTEAITALTTLGYSVYEANKAVRSVKDCTTTEQLIKASLKKLAKL